MAEKYAEEYKRFLEENNATVLLKLEDLSSHLSSVGRQAAESWEHQMAKFANSPAVQKLPHLERVLALGEATIDLVDSLAKGTGITNHKIRDGVAAKLMAEKFWKAWKN